MKSLKYVAVGVAALAAQRVSADVILQDAGQFDRAIAAFDPIGQTFVAIDPVLSTIAFAFSDINPTSPNEPITMTLYAGTGFSAPLHSVTQTLPAVLPPPTAPPQFIDFDFTGIATTVGATYTVAVTVPSSFKVAVVYADSNQYAGGTYIDVNGVNANSELNFRIVGVPAPGAAALAVLALGAGARRRRRA